MGGVGGIGLPDTSSAGQLEYLHLELDDLTTIKASAEAFKSKETQLHVLWNNAGVSLPLRGSVSKQGHELQVATNWVVVRAPKGQKLRLASCRLPPTPPAIQTSVPVLTKSSDILLPKHPPHLCLFMVVPETICTLFTRTSDQFDQKTVKVVSAEK